MKPDYWRRLADAARRVQTEPPAEMPFGFETRVMADWRSQREAEEMLPWTWLLRGALLCASLILLVSLAVNYQTFKEREPSSVVIADSVLRVSMLP